MISMIPAFTSKSVSWLSGAWSICPCFGPVRNLIFMTTPSSESTCDPLCAGRVTPRELLLHQAGTVSELRHQHCIHSFRSVLTRVLDESQAQRHIDQRKEVQLLAKVTHARHGRDQSSDIIRLEIQFRHRSLLCLLYSLKRFRFRARASTDVA